MKISLVCCGATPRWKLQRTFTTHFSEATIERYREIRELAQRLARWDEVRSELLASVQQVHLTNVEIEIALDEGRIDLALELLEAGKQTKDSRSRPYGSAHGHILLTSLYHSVPHVWSENHAGHINSHHIDDARESSWFSCLKFLFSHPLKEGESHISLCSRARLHTFSSCGFPTELDIQRPCAGRR